MMLVRQPRKLEEPVIRSLARTWQISRGRVWSARVTAVHGASTSGRARLFDPDHHPAARHYVQQRASVCYNHSPLNCIAEDIVARRIYPFSTCDFLPPLFMIPSGTFIYSARRCWTWRSSLLDRRFLRLEECEI